MIFLCFNFICRKNVRDIRLFLRVQGLLKDMILKENRKHYYCVRSYVSGKCLRHFLHFGLIISETIGHM